MKPTDFARHLADFLGKYLPCERGMSTNSIKAYRDTFTLLIKYFRDIKHVSVNKLTLDKLTHTTIESFLDWLQIEKDCCASTRNARLAAIRSFFSYLEYADPFYIYNSQNIQSIPLKKAEKKNINYMTLDGIKQLLKQPDISTASGRRDLAMLALMYDTGARVQEIADLTAESVRITKPYTVRITGKGYKTRIIPLMDIQMAHLLRYMKEKGLDKPERMKHPLFTNNSNHKLTRGGITYVLQKYIDMARTENPSLIPDRVSCHSLRHSKAMHLLQADVPFIYIRDLLGHESIVTTEIYAKADSKRKREVLSNAFTPVLDEKDVMTDNPIWLKDDNLLEWLKKL